VRTGLLAVASGAGAKGAGWVDAVWVILIDGSALIVLRIFCFAGAE
jgi:hypothetical protein